jgi:ribosomal protein L11 methyltransferase
MQSEKYYEFTLRIPDESRDAVLNKMMEIGSSGFFEREGELIAYFEDRIDITGICDELIRFRGVLKSSGLDPSYFFEYSVLPEKDWNETWKKNFLPRDVGENLMIVPSWLTPEPGRIPLIIDPGMAFGTGNHETSRACLMFIEKYSKDGKGKRLLDIGTGTGILAIAASKLGISCVTGIDTDPLAIQAALGNAKMNELDNVSLFIGSITAVKGPFDIITANLYSELLIQMSEELVLRLKPGKGIAILSGMLRGQEDGVSEAFKEKGLQCIDTVFDGEWVSLVLGFPH